MSETLLPRAAVWAAVVATCALWCRGVPPRGACGAVMRLVGSRAIDRGIAARVARNLRRCPRHRGEPRHHGQRGGATQRKRAARQGWLAPCSFLPAQQAPAHSRTVHPGLLPGARDLPQGRTGWRGGKSPHRTGGNRNKRTGVIQLTQSEEDPMPYRLASSCNSFVCA